MITFLYCVFVSLNLSTRHGRTRETKNPNPKRINAAAPAPPAAATAPNKFLAPPNNHWETAQWDGIPNQFRESQWRSVLCTEYISRAQNFIFSFEWRFFFFSGSSNESSVYLGIIRIFSVDFRSVHDHFFWCQIASVVMIYVYSANMLDGQNCVNWMDFTCIQSALVPLLKFVYWM